MKLRKRTLLIIIVGIFVIVSFGLGMVRYQQVSEQNQLNEKLVLANSDLERLQLEMGSSGQVKLEEQLGQATSQFEAVKAILSQPVGSITASSTLFEIAEAHGVEVAEMTSSGPVTENLEGITCSVISLTAKVEGDLPNLVSFITNLNNHFATGVVKSIIITIPETTGEQKGSTDIQMVVYTYRGAKDG